MLAWLSVWGEVQICICLSWCHCPDSLASVKSRLVLVLANPGNPWQSPKSRKVDVCVGVFLEPLPDTWRKEVAVLPSYQLSNAAKQKDLPVSVLQILSLPHLISSHLIWTEQNRVLRSRSCSVQFRRDDWYEHFLSHLEYFYDSEYYNVCRQAKQVLQLTG